MIHGWKIIPVLSFLYRQPPCETEGKTLDNAFRHAYSVFFCDFTDIKQRAPQRQQLFPPVPAEEKGVAVGCACAEWYKHRLIVPFVHPNYILYSYAQSTTKIITEKRAPVKKRGPDKAPSGTAFPALLIFSTKGPSCCPPPCILYTWQLWWTMFFFLRIINHYI